MANMTRSLLPAGGILLALAAPAAAQDCNAPAAEITSIVNLPGAPFSALPTSDGCTIFVSLMQGRTGAIAVLQRADGKISLAQTVSLPRALAGMALSRDGKWLAATDSDGVTLFDATRLASGDGTMSISASDASGRPAGSVYAAISPDDRLLFISDENNTALTVYDLTKFRAGNTAAIGRVPVGLAPVGLVFSPDGRTLYSTSEISANKTAPTPCAPEGGAPRPTPLGVLTVIDVAKAATEPASAVLLSLPAGCDPVRVARSDDGSRLFVTERGENGMLVFNTAALASGSRAAVAARVAVGNSPVGVAAVGDRVFVANSNRFALRGRKGEWLSVIDSKTNAVVGAIAAGLFPRELKATADGKTLLVTNFSSQSLELVDLARLTDDYLAQQKAAMASDMEKQRQASAVIAARIKAGTPSPGTEAAVRDQVESLESGHADYDAMTPELAAIARPQEPGIVKMIAQWGALKSVTLSSITPQGMDVYDVEFEHASTLWMIAPLTPEGKIYALSFHPKG